MHVFKGSTYVKCPDDDRYLVSLQTGFYLRRLNGDIAYDVLTGSPDFFWTFSPDGVIASPDGSVVLTGAAKCGCACGCAAGCQGCACEDCGCPKPEPEPEPAPSAPEPEPEPEPTPSAPEPEPEPEPEPTPSAPEPEPEPEPEPTPSAPEPEPEPEEDVPVTRSAALIEEALNAKAAETGAPTPDAPVEHEDEEVPEVTEEESTS